MWIVNAYPVRLVIAAICIQRCVFIGELPVGGDGGTSPLVKRA